MSKITKEQLENIKVLWELVPNVHEDVEVAEIFDHNKNRQILIKEKKK